MTSVTQPPKQLVRDYMGCRTQAADPPPTPDEVRRQLGFGLIDAEREAQDKVKPPKARGPGQVPP